MGSNKKRKLQPNSFIIGLIFWSIVCGVISENGNNILNTSQQSIEETASTVTSFKYKYVTRDNTYDVRPGSELLYIEVSATQDVNELAHKKAAVIISRMLRHTPSHVYERVCRNVRVGVFTHREDPTVFPEFSGLREVTDCKGTCEGHCRQTCTEDGRKYGELAGLGGRRTAVLEDNILCNEADPYGGVKNILVHEFAHSIHQYGLGPFESLKIRKAYENACHLYLWSMVSYAMTDEREYFAESSAVFFYAEAYSGFAMYEPTGGMTSCEGEPCLSEKTVRSHLKEKDVDLFKILSYVYTNNQPWISGNIGPCVEF